MYNQWFNPTGSITEEAQNVHGKSKRDLECYPKFALKDAQNIFGWIKGSQGVICHNYDFDRKILWQQFEKVGAQGLTDYRKWPKFHCTQKMARKIGIKKAKTSLDDLIHSQLGIERSGHHDAKEDARLTAQLWLHLRQYIPTQASSGETIIGFSGPANGKFLKIIQRLDLIILDCICSSWWLFWCWMALFGDLGSNWDAS